MVPPPPEPYGSRPASGASAPAMGPRPRGVGAGTQADAGTSEWTSYDLRRALKLLHSTTDTVVRRTLRRLHIRFWHAASAKLLEILRVAGAPQQALKLVKEIFDTCRICRMWAQPTPKSLTTVRLAHDFNQVVRWDILFHWRLMISHLLDEAIWWTAGSILQGKSTEDLISAVASHWLRHFGPMKALVADGEKGIASEEVAQFLDRNLVQLKTKAPGEHAQMVERHHELIRRLLLRVESQLHAEGLNVPMEVIVAECILAKNVLTTVAGQTPYRALYGREPPGLTEFEPQSETVLDDRSGGVTGHSRNHHRVREMAPADMVQETAQLRIERALHSKTRLAVEQLEFEPGDLVDFWRNPATKDESGWRGPARVVEPGDRGGDESSATTVQWQGSMLQVRTQDLRRALVYCALIAFPTAEAQYPRDLIVSFAEGLQKGQLVPVEGE